MKHFWMSVLAGLVVTGVALGQAAPQGSPQNSLLISPGDNLHISVLDMPDLDQYARVTDKGDVPVEGAGSVYVAKMTPAEAAAAIEARYVGAHYLNHPEVSVVVDQYATQEVTLIGQVKSPGAYPIATPRPILDVLALGGGLTEVADRNVLVERHGDKNNPISYNVSNNGEAAIKSQVMVDPGDTIVIPKAGIVYVLGSVNRPGGYTMSDNQSQMSLLEALSEAGGVTQTAKQGHARLIRKSSLSDIQLSLGEIQKGKQPDPALQPGDILYVPFSYPKTIMFASSAGIVGAAATAAVYATR